MNYDATSLYPSAMWDKKLVYPSLEFGYAFMLFLNDTFVEALKNQIINQDGNDSAILKI